MKHGSWIEYTVPLISDDVTLRFVHEHVVMIHF